MKRLIKKMRRKKRERVKDYGKKNRYENRYAMDHTEIISPGTYIYRRITPQEAIEWWKSGNTPIDAFIYPSNKDGLILLLGEVAQFPPWAMRKVPPFEMNIGDEALIFRIGVDGYFPPFGPHMEALKSIFKDEENKYIDRLRDEILGGRWTLGLLERIS